MHTFFDLEDLIGSSMLFAVLLDQRGELPLTVPPLTASLKVAWYIERLASSTASSTLRFLQDRPMIRPFSISVGTLMDDIHFKSNPKNIEEAKKVSLESSKRAEKAAYAAAGGCRDGKDNIFA